MGSVFISYSSKDRAYVDKLKNILTNGKFDTWVAPESIPVGSNYTQCINDAIKTASAVVLVLSANSLNSQWVLREIERAVTYNKTIFSVQIDSAKLNSAFEFMLGSTQNMVIPNMDAKPEDTVKLLTALGKAVNGSQTGAAGGEPPRQAQQTPSQQAWQTPQQQVRQTPPQQAWQTPQQQTRQTPPQQAWQTPTQQVRQTPPQQAWQTPQQQVRQTPPQQAWQTPQQQIRQTPPQQTRQTPIQPAAGKAEKKKSGLRFLWIPLVIIVAGVIIGVIASGVNSGKTTTPYTTENPYPASTASADDAPEKDLTVDGYRILLPLTYENAQDWFGIDEPYNVSSFAEYTYLAYTSEDGYDLYLRINGSEVPSNSEDLLFYGIGVGSSECEICGFYPGCDISSVIGELGTEYETKTSTEGDNYLCYNFKYAYTSYTLAFFYNDSDIITEIQALARG